MRFGNGPAWPSTMRSATVSGGCSSSMGFDLVVVHKGGTFFAFNNLCPHLHLPLFEKRDPDKTGVLRSPGSGREISRDNKRNELPSPHLGR
jgi:nitrite reductase/ring-hydroxylating ferredoxin subunit